MEPDPPEGANQPPPPVQQPDAGADDGRDDENLAVVARVRHWVDMLEVDNADVQEGDQLALGDPPPAEAPDPGAQQPPDVGDRARQPLFVAIPADPPLQQLRPRLRLRHVQPAPQPRQPAPQLLQPPVYQAFQPPYPGPPPRPGPPPHPGPPPPVFWRPPINAPQFFPGAPLVAGPVPFQPERPFYGQQQPMQALPAAQWPPPPPHWPQPVQGGPPPLQGPQVYEPIPGQHFNQAQQQFMPPQFFQGAQQFQPPQFYQVQQHFQVPQIIHGNPPVPGQQVANGAQPPQYEEAAQLYRAPQPIPAEQLFLGLPYQGEPIRVRRNWRRGRGGNTSRPRRNTAAGVNQLPTEITQMIFAYLSTRQLLNLQRVSKAVRSQVEQVLRFRGFLDLGDVITRRMDGREGTKCIRVSELKRLLKMHTYLTYLFSSGDVCISRGDEGLDNVEANSDELEEVFCCMREACTEISAINAKSISLGSHEDVVVMMEIFSGSALEELSLPPSIRTDEHVRRLLRIAHDIELQDLYIISSTLRGTCFQDMPQSLEFLSIGGLQESPRAPLDALRHCTRLFSLTIYDAHELCVYELANSLSYLPGLRHLYTGHVTFALEQALMSDKRPPLRMVRGMLYTNQTLQLLPDLLPQLAELNVSFLEFLTEADLLHVQHLRQLRTLNLCGLTAVTDQVLTCCHRLPHLVELHIALHPVPSPTGDYRFGQVKYTFRGILRAVLYIPRLEVFCLDNTYCAESWDSLQVVMEHVDASDVIIMGLMNAWSALEPRRGLTWALIRRLERGYNHEHFADWFYRYSYMQRSVNGRLNLE